MITNESFKFSGSEAEWDLNHVSAIGQSYMGTFKFRCALTPLQVIEAGRDYRELLGPNSSQATTEEESFAFALSQLRQRVIEAPPFWFQQGSRFGGGHILDVEVINLVLQASMEAELAYRERLTKKHEEAVNRIKAVVEKRKADDAINKEIREME